MSKRPPSIHGYNDVVEVFDTVLRFEKQATFVLESPRAATAWRHRAHRYREALRAYEEYQFDLPPGTGSSKYDNFVIRVSDATVTISPIPPTIILNIDNQFIPATKDEDN